MPYRKNWCWHTFVVYPFTVTQSVYQVSEKSLKLNWTSSNFCLKSAVSAIELSNSHTFLTAIYECVNFQIPENSMLLFDEDWGN